MQRTFIRKLVEFFFRHSAVKALCYCSGKHCLKVNSVTLVEMFDNLDNRVLDFIFKTTT
jgi:hypothetical protein